MQDAAANSSSAVSIHMGCNVGSDTICRTLGEYVSSLAVEFACSMVPELYVLQYRTTVFMAPIEGGRKRWVAGTGRRHIVW